MTEIIRNKITVNVDEVIDKISKLVVGDDKKTNKNNNPNKKNLKPKKGLTPYQGDLRTFGYFCCESCINDWSSAFSWADTAQKCELCKKFRFPYRQIPFHLMEKRSKPAVRKPHIEPSCGKCLQIKDSCTKITKCDERPESIGAPIIGLSDALENVKPKPPKRKRNRKNKKD